MVGVEEAAAWVALRDAPGVGDVTGRVLLDRFGGPRALRAADRDDLAAAGCAPALIAALHDPRGLGAGRAEAARIVAAGARLIPLDAPEYPALLRQLRDAPLYLVARGAPLVETPAVAIVGSRRATPYGCDVARRLAAGLADAGVTVVSGLARGIDAAAHEGTVEARGCTVAVLGSGIDVVYPPEHRSLAERITESGTLLSERPVGTAPLPAHFPTRNRIIAGMTHGTVVVEAADRSGSSITARLANDAGREVFAVPGRIDSPLSFGPHLLIRSGATLIRGVEDILEQIMPALRGRAVRSGSVDDRPTSEGPSAALLDLLAGGPVEIDELIRRTNRPAAEILAETLDLELRGIVKQLPGRRLQLGDRFAGVG